MSVFILTSIYVDIRTDQLHAVGTALCGSGGRVDKAAWRLEKFPLQSAPCEKQDYFTPRPPRQQFVFFHFHPVVLCAASKSFTCHGSLASLRAEAGEAMTEEWDSLARKVSQKEGTLYCTPSQQGRGYIIAKHILP